ncbi:hypothetical protein CRYUN_Cryun06bG0065100 [Craigia yunnanensis]
MTFPAFVKFALICFDALAWPLFALVCPLRASIQAIEANSNSDIKKLVTYWVIFSLISLFEHAFMGMLQWLPFWPYMKLTIVCWMTIPHFDGAFYIYNHFVHSFLYIDVQTIINWFKKQQEFVLKDIFLAEADKYIKAHGPEALEKRVASKIPETEPNAAQTVDNMITLPDIKGAAGCYPPEIPSDKQVQEWTCAMCQVTTTSEKTLNIHLQGRRHRNACEELMKAKNQPSKGEVSFASVDSVKHSDLPSKEPQPTIINWFKKQQEFVLKDNFLAEADKCIKAHGPEALEKLIASKLNGTEPSILQKDKKPVQVTENREVAPVNPIPETEPNAAQTVDNMITLPDIKGAAGCYPPEIPSDKQVQEWTCAMCQVTTTSEKTLNIHLQGRRHRNACEELMKAKNQPSKGEVSFASVDSVKHSDLPSKEPQPTIINWFKKQQEFVLKDNFLAEADKCIKAHGPEALEKLIASKLKGTEPIILQQDIKPVQVTEKREVAPMNSIPETEPNAAQTVDNMITLPDIKGAACCYPPEIPSDKQVQEWTCAMCQVTTTSEKTLNIHLQGRRHRNACEELMKAKNQPSKGEVSFTSVDSVKHSDLPPKEPQQTIINWFKKQQEFVLKDNFLAEADKCIKAHGPEALEKLIASKLKGTEPIILQQDIKPVQVTERREVAPVNLIPETEPNAAQTVDNMITLPDIKGAAGCYPPEIPSDKQVQEWTCAMCQVTTTSEKTLNIHLQGRRHRNACEKLMKAKNQPSKGEVSFASVDSVKHSDLPPKEPQQTIINWFKKQQEFVLKDNFLAEADKCIKAHGPEALEKLIASKLNGTEPIILQQDIKPVQETEKREVAPVNSIPETESNVAQTVQGQQQVPKKHAEIEIPEFRCTICNISCSRSEDLNCHLGGRKHLARIQKLNSLG